MKEFQTLVFGDITIVQFLAMFLLAGLGAFLSLLMQTTNRKVLSTESPVHFSWSYLWCDNSKRVMTAVILIFIFIRFMPELIGAKPTSWLSICIGYGNDKLAQIFKKKGMLMPDENVKPNA